MADTQRFSLISYGQHNILLNKWTNLANTQCFITFILIFMYLFSSDSIVLDTVCLCMCMLRSECSLYGYWKCVYYILCMIWEYLCMSMYRFIPAHYLSRTQIILRKKYLLKWILVVQVYESFLCTYMYVCLQHTIPQQTFTKVIPNDNVSKTDKPRQQHYKCSQTKSVSKQFSLCVCVFSFSEKQKQKPNTM